MIPYSRDPHQTIPTSAVKIIGLGGAGANMLERSALDGMEGAELLALNTDVRTLATCIAREKIQLGVNLTKGLGSGGDPELGHQAALEAEEQIRASIKGRRIVFLCTGLGGGTGSGASPIITRIAREEGAFVVVFATMPFAFEGKRRREQAETALNELAVLSNALVTFDNNRMGELVLAKQGIHEAFGAADHMICESIKAVIRLVVRPGLINVGLDDLMSALRTNRSRCLFGSGIAEGKDRAVKALRNALNSPLLDQGTLLKDAQTVLVHLSGGEDLTLFEIELLMQRLQKFVPEKAHVLFGAAIDPAMGDSLSITLISALPEDSLAMAPRESLSHRSQESPLLDPTSDFVAPPVQAIAPFEVPPIHEAVVEEKFEPAPAPPVVAEVPEPEPDPVPEPEAPPVSPLSRFRKTTADLAAAAIAPSLFDSERPFAEPELPIKPAASEPDLSAFTFISTVVPTPEKSSDPEPPAADERVETPQPVAEELREETYTGIEEVNPEPIENIEAPEPSPPVFFPAARKKPSLIAPWGKSKVSEPPVK
ncbi:MAG: cell division protein FtsZ, partial [Luteolibacter sp.]